MNKSPQYNQQTEQKQCKFEVEEICIHQNLETGPIAATVSENKVASSMLERMPLKE